MDGIRIRDVTTGRIVRVLAQGESADMMTGFSLYQGSPQLDALHTGSLRAMKMAAEHKKGSGSAFGSSNSATGAAQGASGDPSGGLFPALYCVAHRRARFYSLTRRSPSAVEAMLGSSAGSHGLNGRDIMNEPPSEAELAVARAAMGGGEGEGGGGEMDGEEDGAGGAAGAGTLSGIEALLSGSGTIGQSMTGGAGMGGGLSVAVLHTTMGDIAL